MIKKVIKKGGGVEKFDLNKIKQSLILALESAGISQEKKEKIVTEILNSLLKYFKNKNEIFSSEIEAKIILELEKLSPETLILWRKHRKEKKTNSSES